MGRRARASKGRDDLLSRPGWRLMNTTQVFSIERMNSNEFKRWLLKQGVKFENAKGSHVKLHLNGRQSVLPMHAKELKTGTVEAIKKQLGLKGK
jgi:mRNA interferase HicA